MAGLCADQCCPLAYFIGKNIADLPRLFVIPAFYLSLFLGFSGAQGHNGARYVALLVAVWATSGIGYAASILFNPKNAQVMLNGCVCLLNGCVCLHSGCF